MAFKRTKEDFICERCGVEVLGNGYTNHCPACLWSKHVDKDPGDRGEGCQGLMEPRRVESISGRFRIIHRCTACGFERPAPVLPQDDMDQVIAIARQSAAREAGV
jgi:ribosomal protein L37E